MKGLKGVMGVKPPCYTATFGHLIPPAPRGGADKIPTACNYACNLNINKIQLHPWCAEICPSLLAPGHAHSPIIVLTPQAVPELKATLLCKAL